VGGTWKSGDGRKEAQGKKVVEKKRKKKVSTCDDRFRRQERGRRGDESATCRRG